MAKTSEEIQALKDSWLKDPCWDIEHTEGFEEHEAELLEFHNQQTAVWDEKKKARKQERLMKVMRETSIDDFELAQTISTFSEIEDQVASQDRYIGEFSSRPEIVQAELTQALARATLLLVAQVKRVADALENMDGRDSLADSVALYKQG